MHPADLPPTATVPASLAEPVGRHAARGPGAVSVLVVADGGEQPTGAAVAAAAATAAAAGIGRVLVVGPRPCVGGAPAVVRCLTARVRDGGEAVRLGLAALPRGRVLVLRPGVEPAPDTLPRLLEACAPGVVPVLAGSRTAAYAGRRLPLVDLPAAVESDAALLPTRAGGAGAASGGSATTVAGALVELWARGPRHVRVVPAPPSSPGTASPAHSLARSSYDAEVVPRLDLLAAAHLLPRSGRGTGLREALLVDQATALRDQLLRTPRDRPRLTEEVLVRRLHDLPWSVVNEDAARDVAVLYCFTPYLDTSGLVAAQRLRVRGEVTDVVAQDLGGLRPSDPGSTLLADPVTGRRVTLPGPAGFAGWEPVRRFVDGAVAQVERWIEEHGAYRSVYSRALKLPSHFAAAVLKHRHPAMRWVAEFSDPLLVNPLGDVRVSPLEDDWIVRELRRAISGRGLPAPEGLGLYDWGEQIAYALADELWFTNSHQLELMLAACPNALLAERARGIARVRAHPTLPSPFYDAVDPRLALEPDVVHLGYFGNFYRTRGLHELLDVLPRLALEERSRLHLHVFTHQVGQLRREVQGRDLHDVVTVRPQRPFLEFLALTRRFDVLIANDGASTGRHRLNPYLPSKVSDYLGSGRPIWAIRETGSVLSRIPTAYASEIGDHDGALRVLREALAARDREVRDQRQPQAPHTVARS